MRARAPRRSRLRARPPTGSPISSRTRAESFSRARVGHGREQGDQPGGSVDEQSTAAAQLGRRLGRPHADAHRARRAARRRRRAPSAANAGRSPVSSPANAATAKPVDRARRPPSPLSIGDRRPQLDRHARAASASRPCRAARSAATATTSSARSGAVRQCNVTLTPAFALDEHRPGAARRLVGRGRDRVEVRQRRAGRPCARRRRSDSMPYEPDEREPGDRQRARRGTRPDGRSRRRPGRAGRRARASTRERRRAADARRRDGRRSARANRRSRRAARCPAGCSTSAAIVASTSSTVRRYRVWTPRPPRATTVGSNAQTRSSALSHRIHAHPELKFEEDAVRARGPRACSPTPASTVDDGHLRSADRVLVPGRQRAAAPRDLRGVRRAARASGTRAGTTSSRRRRSAPGSRSRRSSTISASRCQRDRHAGRGRRRRQGLPARTRRVRRRARGDDGAPRADRGPRRRACSAVAHFARALHRPRSRTRRPRRSSASTRPTRSPSRRSRSACCASTSAPATRCTASSRTAATPPNIVPAHTDGLLDGARAARSTSSRELRPRVERCFEAGALATGATLDDRPTSRPSTRTWSTTTTLVEVYRAQRGRARPAGSDDERR